MLREHHEPVDGFTVDHRDDRVLLILSDRYGHGDAYRLTGDDAIRLGLALVRHGEEVNDDGGNERR